MARPVNPARPGRGRLRARRVPAGAGASPVWHARSSSWDPPAPLPGPFSGAPASRLH